jgi:hypothetical protein
MYEKKLQIQENDYLNLEQEKLEMQERYEAKIRALIDQNARKINDLLGSFGTDLNKVQDEYEECKRTASANKKHKDHQLVSLDEEHEDEIDEIKDKHRRGVTELEKELKKLEITQNAENITL